MRPPPCEGMIVASFDLFPGGFPSLLLAVALLECASICVALSVRCLCGLGQLGGSTLAWAGATVSWFSVSCYTGKNDIIRGAINILLCRAWRPIVYRGEALMPAQRGK